MKCTLLFLSFFLFHSLSAQDNLEFVQPSEYLDSLQVEKIYDIVEVSAKFPGGDAELMLYLRENVNYPKQANGFSYQGIVYVSFVVELNGSITNVKVVRGIHLDLDKEAKRVIKGMPNWTPAQNRGRDVRSRNVLPVRFQLK